MTIQRIVGVGALSSMVCLGCGTGEARQEKVNPDAAILQDYQRRIDAYMKLRGEADNGAPKLKETADPARIKAAQDALRTELRAARASAKHGDVFTPDVQRLFRRLLYPELKGPDAAETKNAIKDDGPAPASVPFKVNATYPEKQPLPTVPPDLLARLPKLPEQLEYRIVDKHLILRDVDANLIVDYMLNAIR
jgi:hypothetical protein